MRADAQRNHQVLLDAARDVFVERGPEVALDEIARRAGVGIATLYRRFPDRASLMKAVVTTALDRTITAAERAIAESDEPFAALVRYLHEVIDLRTPAVIPVLLGHLDLETPALAKVRRRGAQLVDQLVTAAAEAGSLRREVTSGDVALMLVRIARPLPGPLDAELQLALAHRHVDLLLAGLRSDAGDISVGGPALSVSELGRQRQRTGRLTKNRPESVLT